MITVLYANELRAEGIKVNAANPGYTATDLNGLRGILTIPEGAAPSVLLATLGDDGPTGTFFGHGDRLPW